MGLDMFLRTKDKQGNMVDSNFYYWRKANQIRNWFVEHLDGFNYDDNCKEFIVPKETIYQLLDDIKIVLDDRNHINGTAHKEIMPISQGFFFGGTEYDDWYYMQLRETYDDLTELLKDFEFDNYDIVYNEWW